MKLNLSNTIAARFFSSPVGAGLRGTARPLRIALATLATTMTIAVPAASDTLTRAALAAWLDRYERAWEERDADQAAALFAPDAVYRETPFDPPMAGVDAIRAYWASVTADQRNVDFRYEIAAVEGQTGVARWHATFMLASSGARVELDGVFELAFGSDGRCSELREWWHSR
jgi:uncharacterized protein (TIGR02246 family)